MSGYIVGVRGCQHLGYAATGFTTDPLRKWNQRITDGHIAHQLTVQSMIDHGVSGIVDGGDIAHFNRPLPRDVEAANRVDDLRHAAGLWGLGNSGNHDAGGGSDMSAAGVMHRPSMGMHAVYPDPSRRHGVGPHPGLYEVHTSASIPGLPDGIALHMVSHYGLAKHLVDVGVDVDPQPLPGHVNLLFAHGTFEADERLYSCIQPHGEERAIPHEWVRRGWDATLLSHYHSLGAVPGFDTGSSGQVWYTGSSLRRGFSDEVGERGWLKVKIVDRGDVTIEPVYLWQRPQHDLPVIDASGLSVADVDDQITQQLRQRATVDDLTSLLTGHGGAIIRQRISGATRSQRDGLGKLRARYSQLAEGAAHWQGLVYVANHVGDQVTPAGGSAKRYGDRVTDFTADLRARYPRLAHHAGVPSGLRGDVEQQAAEWTDRISPDADLSC